MAAGNLIHVAIGILTEPAPGSGGVRVLIARRRDDAVLGGYWEFPGGKLEAGETAAQCLQREFAEEVGLAVTVGAPLPGAEIVHTYPHGTVHLQPFHCTRQAGADHEPRNLEVAEHRWVRPAELRQYAFPPANGNLIARLSEELDAVGNPVPLSGGSQ
jgi:mutator protein MutT